MTKISFAFAFLGIILGLIAIKPAQAQNQHSFVSTNGNGTACTFQQPCASFDDALAATASKGIITCVDQGANSHGNANQQITITKSLTIDCAGTAAGTWFITINGNGIVVTLRNLNMMVAAISASPSSIGIDFLNGAALFVEHCVIEHFEVNLGAGIHFAPSFGTAKLQVTDSVIKNNGVAAGGAGIFITPSGGAKAQVAIERTVVANNTYGVFANGTGGTALVEIKDSVITNNAINGIWAFTEGSTSSIMVDHTISNYNGGSGATASGTFVTLSDSTIVGNATGLSADTGGGIGSYGNNRINGNVSAGATPTSIGFR